MKLKSKILRLIFVFLLFISLYALAWSGKCVAIHNGDTISVMHEGKAERIRLHGIDCPERRQPFSKKKRCASKAAQGATRLVKQDIVFSVTGSRDCSSTM